ncbi:MAG: hypothetical protein FWD04_07510 [Conexibacteraceae bacterium]|nr:hypothetical protein [Conexibacteraceae bacterium]
MTKFSNILRRPRALAGGSLGLAGVGAALVVALGGTAASAPAAFAVTKSNDGSVLVKLSYAAGQNLPQVNAKLAAMGTGEAISIRMASGAAGVSGPVTCTPSAGASGPAVKVLSGSNGTEVIAAGESAGNTAEGTFHLASCVVTPAGVSGNSGAA